MAETKREKRGKYVIRDKEGKVLIWFPSLGRYVGADEWKKMCEELGKQRLTNGCCSSIYGFGESFKCKN